MEFRIVSGDSTGFYAVSDRLTADKAVSLFLSIARSTFPGHIDDPVLTELTLTEWVKDPVGPLIYVGDAIGWRVAIAPASSEDRIPTEN